MIKLKDVLDFILATKDNEVLVEINDAVKDKFKTNSSYLKCKLMPGDKVRINGSGKIEKGTIIKVNRTRALVKCWNEEKQWNVRYSVPFTMITREANGKEI
tara:strand:- start:727 stop:1029 length:303 start_codon:yes stop_codon:yes gene_type:complete